MIFFISIFLKYVKQPFDFNEAREHRKKQYIKPKWEFILYHQYN